MRDPVSIAARLNRLPITRTHRVVVAIAGIGTFFDLFDIFLAGVLGTILVKAYPFKDAAKINFERISTTGHTSEAIGTAIFRTYLVPFEVVSVLLTAAVVGAIAVARRD